MNKLLGAALFAASLALSLPGTAAQTDEDSHRWNLKDLYPAQAEWELDAARLGRQFDEFTGCKDHLKDSARRFKGCLDLHADILKRYARLSSYAAQFNDEDTAAAAGLDLSQRARLLGNRLQESTAFMSPEILRLGEARIKAFLAREKSLNIYRHPLDETLRTAAHTLDNSGEELIANFGRATGAASAIYSTLANADMPWPKVKLADGAEVVLDQSAFTKYRTLGNRDDRKLVFDAFFGKWKEYERSLGVSFYEQLKRDAAYAKVRRYADSLEHALDDNKLPVGVYDRLIEQANANLPTLHRYFKLRARMLGLDQLHYYDIYPPLVVSERKYPIDQAAELVLASVKPLGDDYAKVMEQGGKSRWIDVFPRPRKRSGAYMNGSAYDVHPYMLLNYNDNYEAVLTLAHEWGHAMHSYLANRSQPFITSRYATFTAEIASTTNQVLLLDYMLKQAQTDNERLLYLGSALEGMRGTFFRQAMFAEFERVVHKQVDQGGSLTGEALTRIYGGILKRYHGDAQGVVKIDDAYAIEWAYIPHFYRKFYVFQYATSISAGAMFAEEILAGKPGAKERYLDVLRAGGSRYPYELVKAAGVDLASSDPYQAICARMNRIMDQIETILAKRQ